MKRPGWTTSTAGLMGAVLGASVVGVIVWIGNGITTPEAATVYAALFGGVFSFVTVVGAVHGVSVQIQAQSEAAEAQRQARLRAARAALPATLEVLISHCDCRIDHLVKRNCEPESLDPDAVRSLKTCIEVGDDVVKDQLTDLISIFSIASVRDGPFISQSRAADRWLDAVLRSENGSTEKLQSEVFLHQISLWVAVWARAICLMPYAYGIEVRQHSSGIRDSFDRKFDRIGNEPLNDGTRISDYRVFSELKNRYSAEEFQFCRADWRRVTFHESSTVS